MSDKLELIIYLETRLEELEADINELKRAIKFAKQD